MKASDAPMNQLTSCRKRTDRIFDRAVSAKARLGYELERNSVCSTNGQASDGLSKPPAPAERGSRERREVVPQPFRSLRGRESLREGPMDTADQIAIRDLARTSGVGIEPGHRPAPARFSICPSPVWLVVALEQTGAAVPLRAIAAGKPRAAFPAGVTGAVRPIGAKTWSIGGPELLAEELQVDGI